MSLGLNTIFYGRAISEFLFGFLAWQTSVRSLMQSQLNVSASSLLLLFFSILLEAIFLKFQKTFFSQKIAKVSSTSNFHVGSTFRPIQKFQKAFWKQSTNE